MTTHNSILKANKAGLDYRANGDFIDYRSVVNQMAFDLGAKGVDLSEAPIVTGYRYGKTETGLSHNFLADRCEYGLSMASVNGSKETSSCMWFEDRKTYEYTGVLVPLKGSDGEPLILVIDDNF